LISICSTSKRTILCINYDDSIIRYEKALLERSGYAVLKAESTQQALRLVTMCKCDAVLLDYDMFEMSGCDIGFDIKLVRPELKVVLLSGRPVLMQALASVDAVVPKLEASRQLLPMIADICNRSQDSKGAARQSPEYNRQ
jgi:DNA-binding NtrC family response regulator